MAMTQEAPALLPETTPAPIRDSRWLALAVLCAGMLMIVLDGTILNVTLPAIQRDLGFSQSSLAWVFNAYLIAFGGLLLLAGRLGDLLGRRNIFIGGLVLFTGASLLCGLSQSQEMLIAARFLQGVGGATTSSVILGMIVTMFPEQREQAKAIGVFSFVGAGGASIGLLLGGLISTATSWHWVFFVNIPIGAIAVLLTLRWLPGDRGLGLRHGADILGAVLVTSGLMLGVYTIVETATYGWVSLHTLGLGAISIALLAAFVARQATARNPLLSLSIFRSRNITGANIVIGLMMVSMSGMFFLGALFLQRVLGYDSFQTGTAFLPVSISIGAFSLGFSARLNLRFGARTMLLTGLALMGAGMALFARVPVAANYMVDVFPALLLLGVGAGVAFPALMTLAMSDASESESGLASGLVNTTQQVGGAVGLAVLATLAATHSDGLVANGASLNSALTDGYHLAFTIGVGLMIAAIALAAVVLQAPSPEAEARGAVEPAFL